MPAIRTLGIDAVAKVGETLRDLSDRRPGNVDADMGVLDSLRSMGALLDNGVKSIQWVVPGRPGQKRIAATFNKQLQRRVVERLKPPVTRPEQIDGMLEMADFKPGDQKCRIHPNVGSPITCTFAQDFADEICNNLRHPVRVEGIATVNALTDRIEEIAIKRVTPLEPIDVGAGTFFKGLSFDQLANLQGVTPLRNPKALAGGWPADEDLDDFPD